MWSHPEFGHMIARILELRNGLVRLVTCGHSDRELGLRYLRDRSGHDSLNKPTPSLKSSFALDAYLLQVSAILSPVGVTALSNIIHNLTSS